MIHTRTFRTARPVGVGLIQSSSTTAVPQRVDGHKEGAERDRTPSSRARAPMAPSVAVNLDDEDELVAVIREVKG